MYKGGELVRHFVPAKKDGVGCLYDLVTRKCYYSSTKTALVCGEETGKSAVLVESPDSEMTAFVPSVGANYYADASTNVPVSATLTDGWMLNVSGTRRAQVGKCVMTDANGTVTEETGPAFDLPVSGVATLQWQFSSQESLQTARAMGRGNVTAGAAPEKAVSSWCAVGRTVTLTAVPDDGAEFVEWRGDTEGLANVTAETIEVDGSKPRNLTAIFAKTGGDTYYVVPDGMGDGLSWETGASLDSVLMNVREGDVVLLRQGVHKVSAGVTLTDMKLVLRGGYAAGDADDAPSGDRYSTVITADAALDNVWVSYDPETAAKTVVLEDGEPMKVIKDGALNLPPDYTAKYQVYYPAEIGEGGAIADPVGLVGTFITFTGSAVCDISNVTFSGFGDTASTTDANILAWPGKLIVGNEPVSVRQVALVGNAAKGSLVGCSPNNTANQPCGDFTDVVVKFCRLNEGSAIKFNNWIAPPAFTNCVFESLYGENTLRGRPLALDLGGRPGSASVQGCAFRRLVHISGEKWSTVNNDFDVNGGPNPGFIALGFGTGTYFVRDCDIDYCWVDNNRSTTLVSLDQYANVRNLRMRENYVKMTCTRNVRMSLGSLFCMGISASPIFDNLLVVSNRTVVATAVPPTYGALPPEILAAPVMVYGSKALFGDCVFSDNSVDVSAVEIDAVKIARSVMAVNNKADGLPSVDCVHCTFSGPAAGDDIVLTKTKEFDEFYATLRMACFDCVLWSSAHDYTYAGATVDGRGQPDDCLTLQRCIVKNAGKIPCGVNFVDCTADDPMLAYDPATGVVRPTVAVDGVREHPQAWYMTVLYNGKPQFRDGCDLSTTNMYLLTIANPANKTLASPLMSRRSSGGNYAISDANVAEKPDLLDQLRPVNRATAGAVQTDLPDGRILAAEAHPAGAGAVTIGSQYAGEDGFAEVTASSVDPLYTFQKWVDENGETLSTSATYKCPSTKDYTRIRAVFGAPQAKWTFKVDPEKGAFANGETEIEMTLNPGDDAPGYPEVAANPAWHQTGWDKERPSTVGSADMEFNVAFIPYTKIVYFDTHATGDNDGTSWANAFTKFKDAVAAAGGQNSYVGEVRVRQGRHLIPNNGHQAQFKNVKIIGGWTGNGEERSSDRRLTVFTGDVDDDDVFVDQHGNTVGKVYENGKFIEFRPPTEEEGYWELANHTKDHYLILDSDDTVACTNARIECCSFYGFYHSQYKFIGAGKYLNVTITNCDFIALHQAYSGSQGDIELRAPSRVLDCAFYGHSGSGFFLNAPSTDDVFEFKNVKYLYSTRNFGTGRHVTLINLNKGSVLAEDLEVGHVTVGNYLESGTANSSTAGCIIYQEAYSNHPTKPCRIRNSYFHDIRSPRNDRPTRLLAMEYDDDTAVLENCVFENIEVGVSYEGEKANKAADVIMIEAKTITNCVFRNVSFDYTGDPAAQKYTAFINVRDGIYDTKFENCRHSSSQSNYSFFLMSRGSFNVELGDGTSLVNCSVTNTGASASSLQYDVVALLGGRAVNMNSSPYRRVGALEVRNCSVYAPNKRQAFLVDDLGRGVVADGLTVLGNTVEGGTEIAGILRACTSGNPVSQNVNPATTLINTTIAENTVVSEAPIVATVYRPYFLIDIGWSTFYNNAVPLESYVVGGYKMNLRSSVMTSAADGWVAHTSSVAASVANGIVFANSYVKGVDKTSPYFSGENAFTVEPLMTGVVRNRRQRRYGVYHAPQSPYAHDAELSGVYSDEAPVDAAGVARPPEGQILIGAMQTTYAAPGLMILVK